MGHQLNLNLLDDIEPLQNSCGIDIEWDNDSLSIFQKLFCFEAACTSNENIHPNLHSNDKKNTCNITLSPINGVINSTKDCHIPLPESSETKLFPSDDTSKNVVSDDLYSESILTNECEYFLEPLKYLSPEHFISQLSSKVNSNNNMPGKRKLCEAINCKRETQSGRYCTRHGGRRMCKVEGCSRVDRGKGLCGAHGGGRKCEFPACLKAARKEGLCCIHFRHKYERYSL